MLWARAGVRLRSCVRTCCACTHVHAQHVAINCHALPVLYECTLINSSKHGHTLFIAIFKVCE